MKSSSITESLLKELEEISGKTHLPLEQRLMDTAIWFHRNQERFSDDIPKRVELLSKTFDIFLEMMALAVQRMQRIEGRSTSLYTPRGVIDTDTGEYYD